MIAQVINVKYEYTVYIMIVYIVSYLDIDWLSRDPTLETSGAANLDCLNNPVDFGAGIADGRNEIEPGFEVRSPSSFFFSGNSELHYVMSTNVY